MSTRIVMEAAPAVLKMWLSPPPARAELPVPDKRPV
jgi:hypothetical protein